MQNGSDDKIWPTPPKKRFQFLRKFTIIVLTLRLTPSNLKASLRKNYVSVVARSPPSKQKFEKMKSDI